MAGYEALVILYTPNYAASWPIFLVNVFALPLALLIVDPVVRAYADQMKTILKIRFSSLAVMLAAVPIATWHFGMRGTVTASVLVLAAERFMVTHRVMRLIGVTRSDLPLFSDVGRLAAAAIAAGLGTLLVRWPLSGASPLMFSWTAVTFAAIYVTAVFAAGVPTRAEIGFMRNKLLTLERSIAPLNRRRNYKCSQPQKG